MLIFSDLLYFIVSVPIQFNIVRSYTIIIIETKVEIKNHKY
jgi:hypothetical protein